MPTPLRRESNLGPLTALALAVTVVLVIAAPTSRSERLASGGTGVAWASFAGGERPQVAVGQRAIVVLKAPSLADRVAAAGGRATDADQRRWTSQVLASQRLVLSRLTLQGVRVVPDLSYARVLNGFAAALDPRAVALLERSTEVAGVYPVRSAYPASVSSRLLPERAFGPGSGHRPEIALPGFDGRGVTVALLDTGVDRAQPYLRGRIKEGVDVVGDSKLAVPGAHPDEPAELERHGTQMAGIVVGAGGPADLAGVATGASVLPIRVAGWQRDVNGRFAVYGRTDQVLAGLERAVDPNGDGAADDAARIALVGVVARFAAFADGPLAIAAEGALHLDTLVIAPAGNDGLGDPEAAGVRAYGSIAGPGGAPATLTVGAADLRRSVRDVRVSVRVGLQRIYAGPAPLVGAVEPTRPLMLELAAPLVSPRPPRSRLVSSIDAYFDVDGLSLVAGKAALVPVGEAAQRAVESAARAGAAAVVLYGGPVPGGASGLSEDVDVPVVGIPRAAADAAMDAIRSGARAAVAIDAAETRLNPEFRRVAPFSSGGLAFDGRVKPELVAQGVGIATSEPGANSDGSSAFATVNGSSAAAAVVAGAAALLAHARPALDAPALRSLLVTTARPLAVGSLGAQGAGVVDVGAAAAAEVAATPTSLALGRGTGVGWRRVRDLRLRNVSSRPLRLALGIEGHAEGASNVAFSITPDRLVVQPGRSARVKVEALVTQEPVGRTPAEGLVVVKRRGGGSVRIPWAVTFGPRAPDLLSQVRLRTKTFSASDVRPALLTLRAGAVTQSRFGDEIRPVARLEVELFRADGEPIGLLARLRDLLPGSYAYGLTGRDPEGELLAPGAYRVRLTAWPTEPLAPPTRRTVSFRVR